MLNQAGMCRGKQGNELLIAERPVQKAADQRRQRRPMPCCSSPLPSPVQKGRSSPDEARRRRSDAASAGLQKPLGERPHKEPEQLDPEGRKSQAGQKRKQLPEQGQIKQGKGKQRGSLCFLCLLLSDDKSLRLSTQFI